MQQTIESFLEKMQRKRGIRTARTSPRSHVISGVARVHEGGLAARGTYAASPNYSTTNGEFASSHKNALKPRIGFAYSYSKITAEQR